MKQNSKDTHRLSEFGHASYRIAIIGTGYVGLSTAATLAYLGHHVICVDINKEKIVNLERGELPFHEPYLKDLLELGHANLQFSTQLQEAIQHSSIGFITVGTPARDDGSTDLSAIISAAHTIGESLKEEQHYLIVTKSTVPIGTSHYIKVIAEQAYQGRYGKPPLPEQIAVASNPEFLREGSAVVDALYPDRLVMGAEDDKSLETLRELYAGLLEQTFVAPEFAPRPKRLHQVPLVETNCTSSESIKYAANTFWP
jgi:UDPglucose 6-dehydrogenase